MSGFAATPSAGGETPQAAWAQASTARGQSDSSMEIDADNKDKKAPSVGSMKVIAGDDGHFLRVPILSTPDYSIKIGLTLYKVQQNIYLLDFQKMTGDAF